MKFLTPQENLIRLRLEKLSQVFKMIGLMFLGSVAIFIIYICCTSDDEVSKINECLKAHSLSYCNKEVK